MAKPIKDSDISFVKQMALNSLSAKSDNDGMGPTDEAIDELVNDVLHLLEFGGFLDRQLEQQPKLKNIEL